jgi:hypothetical protein
MVVPSGSFPTVDRIHFRTRSSIRGRTPYGGIWTESNLMNFRHCVFDSLRYALFLPDGIEARITIEDCLFRGDSLTTISAHESSVNIRHCVFQDGVSYAYIDCGANSSIVNSTFAGGGTYHVNASGTGIMIRDCVFGPRSAHAVPAVQLNRFAGSIMNNLFIAIDLGRDALHADLLCAQPSRISGNTFLENRVRLGQGGSGIGIECRDTTDTPAIIDLSENIFIACSSYVREKAISVSTKVSLTSCRFYSNMPDQYPVVRSWSEDTVAIHESYFVDNGLAVETQGGLVDARFNWWGDSSGPYNAALNPDGQGDAVGDNILFEPWLADTVEFAASRPLQVPETYSLSIFPNPFNARTRIRFGAPSADIYSLELFDLLGRRMQELFYGPSVDVREIAFDASGLASGIYFVRAKEVIYNRPLVTAKMVVLR